ncbi:MAG TPA: (2Fe-2S)-binding protein [Bryobacteraceae bacterium]|nr:ferredoxin [Bryobacterales bacterium]HRJ19780.1 (2Fe-2S)-binding protein [Bryobacteraceae bacterium]
MAVIELTVNGRKQRTDAPPGLMLLDLLRDSLGLTGAKPGCGEGACGACTVLLDGRPVKSCITPAASARGKTVVTIEGLAPEGGLHPVQQAFLETEAYQCGYCTPGMILAAAALLDRTPRPADAAIRQALEGHICRCGSYPRIVEAVRLAAREARRD